jgi:putative glutamine amidotransferase
MTAAARGTVLVAAATAAKAAPYVAALAAAGMPEESMHVVTATRPPASAAASAGAGAAVGTPSSPAATPVAAVAVTPASRASAVAELAATASGLVLCGGDDVDPRRYGEEPLPGAGVEPVPERDALEWELLAAARARRLPVWAICRGFQVINVFFGGSLWQDLPLQRGRESEVAHDPGPPNDRLAHAVRVLAPAAPIGERLAAAGTAPRVNSRHHQGVKRLGDGLLAVATAEDGLVEAAVLAGGSGANFAAGGAGDGWWVRGVEWHPENLLALSEQLALWHDFADAVRSFTAGGRP